MKNQLHYFKHGALAILLWLLTMVTSGLQAGGILMSPQPQAVDSVVIGTATTTFLGVPVNAWYGFSFTQTLYRQNEINVSQKVISRIGYHYAGSTPGLDFQVEIYMTHTQLNALTGTVQLTGHVKVYDGTWVVQPGSNFSYIDITPFYYNGLDNLLVTVIEKKPGWTSTSDVFYATEQAAGEQLCVGLWNDQTPYNPQNLPPANPISFRANTKLWFDQPPTGPALMQISPLSLDFGEVEVGGQKLMHVVLKNAGVDLFEVTGFTSSDASFQVVGVNFPIQLGMLESRVVPVRFSPTQAGLRTATITFHFDPQIAGDRSVSVFGSGVNFSTVQIGTDSILSAWLPFSPWYGYSFSQTIYLQPEINISNKAISRIGYSYSGVTQPLEVELEIYMAHTSLSQLDQVLPLQGHQKVFDDVVTFESNAGFLPITIDKFFYNNTDNLVVTVIEKRPGWTNSGDMFHASESPGGQNMTRYARNDQAPYDPNNLPNGLSTTQRANIRLWMADPPDDPIFEVQPQSLDFGQVELTQTKTLQLVVRNKGGGTLTIGGINFSNPTFNTNISFPQTLGSGQSLTVPVTFAPTAAQLETGTATFLVDASIPGAKVVELTGRGLRFGVLREGFENELFPPLGWIVIDANNDGEGWLRNTGFVPTGQTAPHTGVAAASLDVYAGSPGQISYDDWLITPEMIWQDGDLFSFWIKRVANQSGQRWRIGYTTGNPEPSNFVIIDEIIDPPTSYIQKSYDMSQFGLMSGEVYRMGIQFYSQWCWPGVIDDVMGSVLNRLPNDLMVAGFGLPQQYVQQNASLNASLTLANYGLSAVQGSQYMLQLVSFVNGNETVLSQMPGINLQVGEIQHISIPLSIPAVGNYEIFARVHFPDDMNPANNTSQSVGIYIVSGSTVIRHAGDYPVTNQTGYTQYYPINFEDYRGSSLTQTLYPASQLATGGMLNHLAYYKQFTSAMLNRKVKIWIGETAVNALTSYQSPSSMQLVFDGRISVAEGKGNLIIPFQRPFYYTGNGNLLVTVYYYDGVNYTDLAKFAYSEGNVNRTIYESGWQTINPENPANVSVVGYYPVTSLFFETGPGLGSLTGRVLYQHNNSPVQDAEVTVAHPAFPGVFAKVKTDSQGYYTLPYAVAGQGITVRITKYGYNDVLFENVQLNPGGSLNLGVALLTVRPTISLSGSVLRSDTQQPAGGALVKLFGIDNYQATTGTNGQFVFPAVWGNTSYQIQISLAGYQTLSQSVTVGPDNTVLPPLVLSENAPAPNLVTAVNEGNQARVRWFAAGQPYPFIFRYDDGIAKGVLITPGNPDIVVGSVWRYDAVVQSVQWYTYSTNYPPSSQVRLILLGLNPDDSPDPGQVLAVYNNIPNLYGWNSFTLPNPVNAPNGFFFGIAGYNNNTLVAYDDGVGEPYEWKARTQWGNGLGAYIPLENGTSPPLRANIFIRAAGLTNGPLPNPGNQVYVVDLQGADARYTTLAIEPHDTGEPDIALRLQPHALPRAFESYSVFRRKHGTEQWQQLNNQPVVDTSFVDTGFGALGFGVYQYGVEANYTNGVTSVRALSNPLEKDMRLTLQLQVGTNTGVAGLSAGALVRLVNNNGNANYVYQATVGSNGQANIPNVLKGVYTLTVSKAGFETFTNSALNLEVEGVSYQYSLMLNERIDDPYSLLATTAGMPGGSARLSWNQPPLVDNMEAYPAFVTGQVGPWKMVDMDGKPTVYPANVTFPNMGQPMAFMVMNRAQTNPPLSLQYWSANSGEQYFAGFASNSGTTNNWLISSLQQHSLPFTLSFYAKSVTDNYGLETFRIGYSTTTDQPADFVFITPNVEVPMHWTSFSYTFPPQARYVAIRHNSTAFALLIDDLRLGVETDGASPGNGFSVFLNNTLIASGLQNPQYVFQSLSPGTYTAGVQANYYTGNSNIVTTPLTIPYSSVLQFIVNTSGGQPVDGALVQIHFNGNPVISGTTASGQYQAMLYPDTYSYTVSKQAYQTVSGTVQLGNTPATVNIVMQGNLALTFVVRNSQQQPVINATVVLGNNNQTTNAQGLVAFTRPAGLYQYAVSHPNYLNVIGAVNIQGDTSLLIIMPELCQPPVNLTAFQQGNLVTLSWQPPQLSGPGTYLHWDGNHNNNGVGTNGPVDFDIAQRFTPDDLEPHHGKFITRIRFVPREANCSYSVRVWKGGTISGPAEMVVNQPVPNPVIGAWNEVFLQTPVWIDASQELWIGVRNNTNAGYPAGIDAGPAINGKGNMINLAGGGWQTLLQVAPTLNYNWSVRAFAETAAKSTPVELEPLVDDRLPAPSQFVLSAVAQTPLAEEGNPGNLLGYNIYKSGQMIAAALQATTYTYTETQPGVYCYTVRAMFDQCGESPNSNAACVDLTVGLPGNETGNKVSIFPNPAKQQVRIVAPAISRVQLSDVQGQVLETLDAINDSFVILDISNLKPGIYFIRLQSAGGITSHKLVVD